MVSEQQKLCSQPMPNTPAFDHTRTVQLGSHLRTRCPLLTCSHGQLTRLSSIIPSLPSGQGMESMGALIGSQPRVASSGSVTVLAVHAAGVGPGISQADRPNQDLLLLDAIAQTLPQAWEVKLDKVRMLVHHVLAGVRLEAVLAHRDCQDSRFHTVYVTGMRIKKVVCTVVTLGGGQEVEKGVPSHTRRQIANSFM